ncbi:MAG: YicC/YloC family endoribonuclease [Flavobacteriaceae bacterium]|nr:YicC/YloC family endoribonuclease [Flavobacteriaceae bacterium]
MLYSLTGFGKADTRLETKTIQVEIKALNSKSLDLNLRAPALYRSLELPIRQSLSERLVRGKIDVFIQVEYSKASAAAQIQASVVGNYIEQLQNIDRTHQLNSENLLEIALRLPESHTQTQESLEDSEREALLNAVHQATKKLIEYRQEEGKAALTDLRLRIDNIKSLQAQTKSFEVARKENTQQRLRERFEDAQLNVDENRFEQELIFYLEKLDVTEEQVRLAKHLEYFEETLLSDEVSIGKKLGFIAQEVGREVNTLGSKANHAEMQRLVIQMKDELEKIKEQLLNVL